jgi:hypothetical protein
MIKVPKLKSTKPKVDNLFSPKQNFVVRRQEEKVRVAPIV